MYDLVVWTESQDASASLLNVAALAKTAGEDKYTVSGDGIFVKERFPYLVGVGCAYESDAGGEIAFYQDEQKIKYKFGIGGADTGTLERNKLVYDLRSRPLPLTPGSYLYAQTKHKTNEQATLFAWLGDGIQRPYIGPIDHVVKFESTTTTTVDQLTECTLSLGESLPSGRYAIVGVHALSQATALASSPIVGRFKFPESNSRAGFVVSEGGDDSGHFSATLPNIPFNKMPLSNELSFKHDNLPTVQLLGAVAATEHTLWCELKQISGIPNRG